MADETIQAAQAAAADDKMTQSRPVQPVVLPVIALGDASKMATGTVATTEGAHVPNFVLQVIPPVQALVVRFGYLFLTTLSGAISLKLAPPSANLVVHAIQAADFWQVLDAGCTMAFATAFVGLVKDLSTIFSGLAKRYPLLTGNV